jgi:hypothetical protein
MGGGVRKRRLLASRWLAPIFIQSPSQKVRSHGLAPTSTATHVCTTEATEALVVQCTSLFMCVFHVVRLYSAFDLSVSDGRGCASLTERPCGPMHLAPAFRLP